MAIQKSITDDKGQVTTYHRIIAFAPVFLDGQQSLEVNLGSYTSQDYRLMEKDNGAKDMRVSSTVVKLPLRDDDTYTRSNLYKDIMALSEWSGSIEV